MEITYVRAVFTSLRETRTIPLYRTDNGVILKVIGIEDLPEYFEVDFANSKDGTTVSSLGHDGEVVIPNELLKTGLPIWCYIYLTNDTTGRTVYTVTIPVKQRGDAEGREPAPEQEDIINQAITALNTAGDFASQSASEAQTYAERAETASESAEASQESATQSAESASQSAQDAAQSATNASGAEARARRYAQDANVDADRAEMAAKNAGYFDVEIDARDHLIYTRTDEVDADFVIDTRGHLVMEVSE